MPWIRPGPQLSVADVDLELGMEFGNIAGVGCCKTGLWRACVQDGLSTRWLHTLHALALGHEECIVQLKKSTHHPCCSLQAPQAPRFQVMGDYIQQAGFTDIRAGWVALYCPQQASHDVHVCMACVLSHSPLAWVETAVCMVVCRHGMHVRQRDGIPASARMSCSV